MQDITLITKTVDYIEENLDRELTLDHISEQMNYSKFHLNRVFAEKVGTTIYKYIQMRRLTEAAKQLVETNRAIIHIAYDAQYNSQQSFMFAFKQLYLNTPQTYRNNGIFIPKQNKFTLHNGHFLLTSGEFKKREVMAA